MIPFVKLHTRRFHITSKVFLRKIAPKTSSKDHKNEFTEVNSDSSCSCPDYLGIESETNVITVIPQNHQFQRLQRSDNREIFHRASFGIVRFDADNKLKHHAQYKSKVDFTFPHSSSEAEKVTPMSKTYSYKNQNLSLNDSTLDIKNTESTSSERNSFDANYIDEFYFGTSETQNNTQLASDELNYLEKNYFGTLVDSKDFSVGQTASNYVGFKENVGSACNKNQVEELNYFEKDYFETLTDSENLHLEQNSSNFSNSKTIDSSLNDKDKYEEINYLEQDYFEALNNSESHFVKQNISTYTDYEEKINSACNNQNIFSKSNNFTPADNELSFLDKTNYENSLTSNVPKSSDYDGTLQSSSNFLENKDVINETMHSKSFERIEGDEIGSQNEASHSIFTDNNVNEVIKKQAFQSFKKLPSSKAQKINIMSHKNSESLTKNSNISKELCNDFSKPVSVESNFKFSKVFSEKPIANSCEISTAHDFVTKLREEQKVPSQINISKGKSVIKEKVDSKGFRVLKNQVPDLTYFTRDETLNLLKQNIVYSDDDLLILNKPYSLVMHESKTTKEPCLSTFLDDLAKEIDKQSENPKLLTVHRLDKETTGCLLLARNETMAMKLKALFAQRKIVKKYWIITVGVPDPPEGVIDMPISEGSIDNRMRMVLHPKLSSDIMYRNHSKPGKPAVTTYKVISQSGNAALVEVFPKTGIKHQIRVHFGFGLGCPILGDHKYSHLDKLVPQKLPSDMLQRLHVRQSKVRHIAMHIHAKSVGIPEYFDKRDLFVNIPIPDYFKINLKRLKFRKKDMIH